MPMTGSGMKASIKSKLNSKGFNIDNPATGGEADKYIEAIAEAVVEYIQANAITITPVTGGSSAGSYPGTIL